LQAGILAPPELREVIPIRARLMLLEPRDQGETTDRRRCFLGLQPADVGLPLGLAPMVVVARDVDRD